ncbi:C40 family peptidase [Mucilaginibacter lappiensis]|uniref:Cell wall-associated NlpC family hydrolase n=1 Tax=Mucilaginibacter lappiensis TaxID=354630 RepID=A0A841J7F7_9SPHI|nr:C40 family peptidase [Mucilaginibacter lappiensis]MBB6126737.1 cell wall-associated NlpC family hydrolase [Mucilaginibacter lappiensis]
MSKYLILLIFIGLTTSLFSKTHVRKIRLTHKIKTANTCLSTDSVSADTLLHFAQSLLGTRYRSRCSDPLVGFDCSGFVSYVFKKFNFNVPRSSCEFISVGQKVRLEDARPGDIILFTGTKKHTRRIGHVGIVYCNSSDEFKFIHSTSGKEHGVTISNMDERYKRRFVQVIRLLI